MGHLVDPNYQQKLDFSKTFAFENFKVDPNPFAYEFSNIDIQPYEVGPRENDYFTLFDFSAKYDPVPTMLTQDHTNVVKGFMGNTNGFHKELINKDVTILGSARRDRSGEISLFDLWQGILLLLWRT